MEEKTQAEVGYIVGVTSSWLLTTADDCWRMLSIVKLFQLKDMQICYRGFITPVQRRACPIDQLPFLFITKKREHVMYSVNLMAFTHI